MINRFKTFTKKAIAATLVATTIISSGMIPQNNYITVVFNTTAVEVSAAETRSYTEYNPYSFYDAFVWIYNGDMNKYNDYLDWLLYMDREGIDLASSRGVEEWEYSGLSDKYPAKAMYYYLSEVKNAYNAWDTSKSNGTLPKTMYAKENIEVYADPNDLYRPIFGAGFTAGATVHVIENMNNGWSKVVVEEPWKATAVLKRAGLFNDAENYIIGIFGDPSTVYAEDIVSMGYVKTNKLAKKPVKKYFEMSSKYEYKQVIKKGYKVNSFKKDLSQTPSICPQVFCNINSRIKYATYGEYMKLAGPGNEYSTGVCGGTTEDIYGFLNYIFITPCGAGNVAWSTVDLHESTHALELYIREIFENTKYYSLERCDSYDSGMDFSAYYLPMMYDNFIDGDGISDYSIREGKKCELSADMVSNCVTYAQLDIKKAKELSGWAFDSKKRAKQAIKQVKNYLTAANALINAQHMLSYYFYMQDSGKVASSVHSDSNNGATNTYTNKNDTVQNKDLYPEVKIHFFGYNDAYDHVGDYTIDEFPAMYLELKDREDVVIFLNVYSDINTTDVTTIEYDGTLSDLMNDLPVKDLRSTYIEITDCFTGTGYELHVSGNLNHITFDDFINSTEYGKHLLENAGLSQ